MLPDKINLAVVTPERHVLEEPVDSVEVPAKTGFLGILPGHAPLLTELGIGLLTYKKGNATKVLTVIHGFAEVLPDRVIILAELSERAEEINTARAQSAAERARERLSTTTAGEEEWKKASFSLERALVRLQATEKASGSPAS
jgi:F-type H+-transporting ATPase subunit epsilon